MIPLTPDAVNEILTECMATDDDPPAFCIEVEGYIRNQVNETTVWCFNRDRIAAAQERLLELTHQLPDAFWSNSPQGGELVSGLGVNRDGLVWIVSEWDCEFILVLAIGAEIAAFELPREEWADQPNGEPRVRFFEPMQTVILQGAG